MRRSLHGIAWHAAVTAAFMFAVFYLAMLCGIDGGC